MMNYQQRLTSAPVDTNNGFDEQLKEAEETIERLRRELEFSRHGMQQAIKDAKEAERSQHKVEIDAVKKEAELNQLRVQAEEVAKRRKIEKELVSVKSELQTAQESVSEYQLEHEDLKQQLQDQKEKTRLEAQEEIAIIRSQAKEAWRHAEEETSRLDGELTKFNQRLENERQHRQHAEQTIAKLESTISQLRQNEPHSDSLDKKHFDQLLKKAHLAIRNLQDRLKKTVGERDEYYKELLDLREHFFEHFPEYDNDETPSVELRSRSETTKSGKVIPINPANLEHLEKSALYKKPKVPEEVDFNTPIFGDDISDELLLIEPDNSFENMPEDNSLNNQNLKNDAVKAAKEAKEKRDQEEKESKNNSSINTEDQDDEINVADIARELLNNDNNSQQASKSQSKTKTSRTFQYQQDDTEILTESEKSGLFKKSVIALLFLIIMLGCAGFFILIKYPESSISNKIRTTFLGGEETTKPIPQNDTSTTKTENATEIVEDDNGTKIETDDNTNSAKPIEAPATVKTPINTGKKPNITKRPKPEPIKKPAVAAKPQKIPAAKPVVIEKPSKPTETEEVEINTESYENHLQKRIEEEQAIRQKAEAELKSKLKKIPSTMSQIGLDQ